MQFKNSANASCITVLANANSLSCHLYGKLRWYEDCAKAAKSDQIRKFVGFMLTGRLTGPATHHGAATSFHVTKILCPTLFFWATAALRQNHKVHVADHDMQLRCTNLYLSVLPPAFQLLGFEPHLTANPLPSAQELKQKILSVITCLPV